MIESPERMSTPKHEFRHRVSLPISTMLGLLTGLLVLGSSLVPLRDVDLYWHLLAGRELAAGASPRDVGRAWSFATEKPWMSTQWLAELALYWIHQMGGWTALAAYRVITLCLILAILGWTTLRGRPGLLASGPFLFAAFSVWLTSEERPQQVTYIGAASLGGVLLVGLTKGSLPRWWVLLPLTALWANVHGGWVLVPGVMALIGLGRILDHGLRDAGARRAWGLALGGLLVGAFSPAGVANVSAVLRFSNAASGIISEWKPTAPFSLQGFSTAGMLGLAILGWARLRGQAPRSEVMSVLALVLFSWTAWRNVTPAMLIVAPLVADRLCQSFGAGSPPEPRWSRPLGLILAIAGALLALVGLTGRQHLPTDEYPVELAARVSALPTPQRILNDYAVGGLVLYFGGGAAQVGIDGRTDRYGSEYITRYREMIELRGDWDEQLGELGATAALLKADAPLAHVLRVERGWTEVSSERNWILLQAPVP